MITTDLITVWVIELLILWQPVNGHPRYRRGVMEVGTNGNRHAFIRRIPETLDIGWEK